MWFCLAALLAMTGWGVGGALAGAEGKADYLKYCASCHGATGKGGGPEAKVLKTPPADLTKMAELNIVRRSWRRFARSEAEHAGRLFAR